MCFENFSLNTKNFKETIEDLNTEMDDADADDDGNNKGDSRNESNLCSPKMEVVGTFLLSNEEQNK